MSKSWVYLPIASVVLSGCAVTAQRPDQVATSDGTQIARISNNILLANILRSRDYIPVNYVDIPAISHTTSEQVGLTAGIQALPYRGASGSSTFTPSGMLTSSPTTSISSLNNSGFVIAMMQPVNQQYLVSKWNNDSNINTRKLLLLLMIKSIQIPAPVEGGFKRVLNDGNHHAEFKIFVDDLFGGDPLSVETKSLTVMEAVGPPFDLINTTTITAPAPVQGHQAVNQSVTANNLTGLTLATNLSDGQFHVGNAEESLGQLYHVYPAQVVLCALESNKVAALTSILGKEDVAKAVKSKFADFVRQLALSNNFITTFAAKGGGPTSTSTSSASAPAASGGGGGGNPSSAAFTQTLIVNRISALGDAEDCEADEIVVDAQPEHVFADKTKNFIHIEWRSPADIVEYLGMLLRSPDVKDGLGNNMEFSVSDDMPGGGTPYLKTVYNNKSEYFSGDALKAIRILDELVNSAKSATAAPVSQPIVFVP